VRGLRIATAAFLLLASACGVAAPSPEQVAERFWEALRAGDFAAAKQYASASSAMRVHDLGEARQIEEVLLGEVLLGEDSAIVQTSLATSLEDGRTHTTFDTHLVREAQEWRVDVEATKRELTTAIFANNLQQIGEAVGQGVQEFSEAIEAGAAEMKQAILEALEELKREFQ